MSIQRPFGFALGLAAALATLAAAQATFSVPWHASSALSGRSGT